MSRFYKLVGKLAVPITTSEYSAWIAIQPNDGIVQVCENEYTDGQETIRVSTVFLMGINHRWMDEEDPLLFETLVLGGTMNNSQWRYTTWEQAERGHQSVIEQLMREMPDLKPLKGDPAPLSRENIPTRFARIIQELCPSQKN